MVDQVAVRLEGGEGEMEGPGVRRLMNELLEVLPRYRREAVVEERFRSLDLAELLVAESERFEEVSPGKAGELAEAARMVADQAYPAELLPRADRVLLRAHALQANTRRLSRDPHGAEVFFERAMSVLAGAPGAAERGFFCQRLAGLREEQGRREEAAALLGRALELFREAGDAGAEGVCLCRLGFLALADDDPGRASRRFVQARGLLEPGIWVARCNLGLALCLAALGRPEEARGLWERSRISADVDPRALLELDWLEGRLAVLLGDHREAVGRLNSVRRRLFIQRRLLDAALCSLDLARAFAAMGRESRIQELIDDLSRAWPVSFDQERAALALAGFAAAVREGRDAEGAALAALDLIRRPMAILGKS